MAELESQIAEFQSNFAKKAPPEAIGTIQSWVAELSATGIEERSLGVGQTAPDFTLPDAHGQNVHLADLRADGPVVVLFYRGGWCPYCNLTLRAYQAVLPEIEALGATFVSISPQTPDNSLTTAEKVELAYPVLSDKGNAVARAFGLAYRLGDSIYALSQKFGTDLTKINGDDSRELPLVGTFVIDQSGSIRFAQVFADHSKRTEPAEVLDALRHLQTPY